MPLAIVTDPAALKRICRSDFTLDSHTITEMFRIMREAGGMGLAAPQVGIDARLFVTYWDEIFINPSILKAEWRCVSEEGCLSLPGVKRACKRWNRIKLLDGREYDGLRAIVIQHELDHLNGTLITDQETCPW
jgi:peptide deformylase